MSIGEVIRTHRKKLGITQEEMANRLGVTAPAVSKWEIGCTQPDISLLAPIARLLGITTDTLLSYKDNLTEEELSRFVKELDTKLDTKSYAEAFAYAREKIEEYPNCHKLIWMLAIILESRKVLQSPKETPHLSYNDAYDEQICRWFLRALESEEETVRKSAAESLCCFYVRRENYEEAAEYLACFSENDPDKKRYQALLYGKTGKTDEAYKAYERLLLTELNRLRMLINDLRILYMKDNNLCMAHRFADIESGLAALFEMGAYQESAGALELATYEKDVKETERIMRLLLESSDTLTQFTRSDLFRHLYSSSEKPALSFVGRILKELQQGFLEEETYGYMRGNDFWEDLKQSLTQSNTPPQALT